MEYIIHYGIEGQKWGIRRFQNPDGSLTAAGQKRYNKVSSNPRIKERNKQAAINIFNSELKRAIDDEYKNLLIEKLNNITTETIEAGKDYVANRIPYVIPAGPIILVGHIDRYDERSK